MKIIAAVLVVLLFAAPVLADVADEYKVRNAGDLVSLCSRDLSAEDYVAAMNFCHGFAVGAYAYYQRCRIGRSRFEDRLLQRTLPGTQKGDRRFRGLEQGQPVVHEGFGGGHVFPIPGRGIPVQIITK